MWNKPVITLRPGPERGHTENDWLNSYHTFSFDEYLDPNYINFGALRVINEDRVAPGKGFRPHSHQDMDIVTIVLEGALAHEDSLGNGSVIQAGDVQRMTAGTGISHSEFNHSGTDPVHFLQIWIFPVADGLAPDYEQKAFEPARAQGVWQRVTSQFGEDGSVSVQQDINIYRTFMAEGQSLSYSLGPERQAWLHVPQGTIKIGDTRLSAGDGAGFRFEENLEIECVEAASLYLFEMAYSEDVRLGDDV